MDQGPIGRPDSEAAPGGRHRAGHVSKSGCAPGHVSPVTYPRRIRRGPGPAPDTEGTLRPPELPPPPLSILAASRPPALCGCMIPRRVVRGPGWPEETRIAPSRWEAGLVKFNLKFRGPPGVMCQWGRESYLALPRHCISQARALSRQPAGGGEADGDFRVAGVPLETVTQPLERLSESCTRMRLLLSGPSRACLGPPESSRLPGPPDQAATEATLAAGSGRAGHSSCLATLLNALQKPSFGNECRKVFLARECRECRNEYRKVRKVVSFLARDNTISTTVNTGTQQCQGSPLPTTV